MRPAPSTADLEARLGPRGSFATTRDNRWDVRKWLTAQGLKSDFVNRLSYAELAGAYNDGSGHAITMLRHAAANENPPVAGPSLPQVIAGEPAADLPFDLPAPVAPAPVKGAEPVRGNGHASEAGTVDVTSVAEMLAKLFAQSQKPTLDFEAVRKIVHEEVAGIAPRPIEIRLNDAPAVTLKERVNPVFDRVLKLVSQGQNVMLVGPAGCGKSHLCEQIARAFKADFGAIHGTAGASESALTGWLLPSDGGKFEYVPSRFVTLYEQGNALFCFDEIDAFDPNMLMVVNGALSNGHIHIAHRKDRPATPRGPDMRMMATANTYGTGANPIYTARAALDGATNDRWIMVTVDYDRELESDLGRAAGLSASEMSAIWNLRDKVRETGLRRIVSTRAFQKAGGMKAAGDSWAAVMSTLTEGWTRDEKAKVGA